MGEMRQRKDGFGHEFNNISIVKKILKLSHKHFKLNKSKLILMFPPQTSFCFSIIGLDLSWHHYLPVHSSQKFGRHLDFFFLFAPHSLPLPITNSYTFSSSVSPLSLQVLNSVLHFCKNCQFLGLPCPKPPIALLMIDLNIKM